MKKLIILTLILTTVLAGNGYVQDLLYHDFQATTYPSTINAGDQGVIVELQIVNKGSQTFYDINSELMPTGPFEGVSATQKIDQVYVDESATLFYKLNIAKNATPGEYHLVHKINYKYNEFDSNGKKTVYNVTSDRTVAIVISVDENIKISNVYFEPNEIYVGDQVTLHATIENIGGVNLNDVSVSYAFDSTTSTTITTAGTTVTQSPFTDLAPISRTKETINLGVGESKDVTFQMNSLDSTSIKAYRTTVTATAGSTSVTDSAVLNVKGKPDLRLAGVQLDQDILYQNKPFSLSIQLENIGKVSAKAVKVELIDGNLFGTKVSYVGTIDDDDTGTAIFDLKDPQVGNRELTAKVSYEDQYGNKYSMEEKVNYAQEQVTQDNSWMFILVLVVAVIGFYLWRRMQKKKAIQKLVK